MVAYTADNHIGVSTQWSIGERGQDFLSAFSRVVDGVLDSGCSALVIGGDLFDMTHPPSWAVEHVQSEICRLKSGHVGVYGIDGNHDVADGKWLRVCGIEPLIESPTVISKGVTACGIGYQRAEAVVETIHSMADRGVRCNILVLHLAFGELNRMGAASDVSSSDIVKPLKEMGVKLVLMGHIHIRQSVEIEGITFAYPGSTEMCSMNEPTEKSFSLVDGESLSLLEPVCIRTRKIESIVVSTEEELAMYEASRKDKEVLQSIFVTPNICDGVKRLKKMAKDNGLLMRVQVMHPRSESSDPEDAIDRSAGVIGLEQAISLSFKPDSEEAGLVRAILQAPEALKVTVENYMHPKKEGE